MPSYVTVEEDPDIIRIEIPLKAREKFRTYVDNGRLFVKILKKATLKTKEATEEAFGILFEVKGTYVFASGDLNDAYGCEINPDIRSTSVDCGKGLLEIKIPYITDESNN